MSIAAIRNEALSRNQPENHNVSSLSLVEATAQPQAKFGVQSVGMRRTLGTDMQRDGTLKDAQVMLHHASIKTTGDVYVQTIEQCVLQAVNSRTVVVLEGWVAPVGQLGLKGRNLKDIEVIRRRRKRKCL